MLLPFKFPTDLSLGEDAVFTCVVKRGDAPVAVRWLKNGRALRETERVVVNVVSDRLSTLTIRRIEAGDVGNYSCVASNPAGTAAIADTLVVTGDPPHVRQGTGFPDPVRNECTGSGTALKRAI